MTRLAIKKILDGGLRESSTPHIYLNNVLTFYTDYEIIEGMLYIWQYNKLWCIIQLDRITSIITL